MKYVLFCTTLLASITMIDTQASEQPKSLHVGLSHFDCVGDSIHTVAVDTSSSGQKAAAELLAPKPLKVSALVLSTDSKEQEQTQAGEFSHYDCFGDTMHGVSVAKPKKNVTPPVRPVTTLPAKPHPQILLIAACALQQVVPTPATSSRHLSAGPERVCSAPVTKKETATGNAAQESMSQNK